MITVNNTPVLEDFYEPAPKLDNSHRQYLDNTYGSNYIVKIGILLIICITKEKNQVFHLIL